MCCCGKPTVNGEPGYSWDGRYFSVRQPAPPQLAESDELIYDEPGRCGGLDCHAHHFRLVKSGCSSLAILVRHGGGDERINLPFTGRFILPSLEVMDSNARYWLLHTIYSTHRDATRATRDTTNTRWRLAAAEKRIKTCKQRGRGLVKVWIEDPPKTVEGFRDEAA